MKKYATLLIGALLIWNTVLTVEYLDVKNLLDSMEITGEVKTIRTVVTEFNTDVTRIVENTLSKVVGVSNYYQDELVGTGSGAIYGTENGDVYIVTNNHVIDGATKVEVTFANGEKVVAVIVGADKLTDLALLKVTVDFTVSPFTLGDSSLVKTGENVLAIGSPLGFEFSGSVTMGIISGTNRIIPVDLDNDGNDDWDSIVLQTDAAINPGNSGGPLVNMAGELIGITSMKITDSSVEGMGFAIPINEITPIIEQLKANGKVIRPILGISAVGIDEMTTAQKSFYGIQLDLTVGIMITGLQPGSPAAKAGLKAKDVITAFGDTAVESYKQFRKILYEHQIGDEVVVTYVRKGVTYTTTVTLE